MSIQQSFARAVGYGVGIAWVLFGLVAAAATVSANSESLVLADPAAETLADWEHRIFGTATDYARVVVDGRPAIRAIGRNSASGLYRDVDYELNGHPWLEWSWRVDRLQDMADIREKAAQDFAAAIFLIFEERMLLMRHRTVLSYVWTNDRLSPGAVVESPFHPETSRSVVVEAGRTRLKQWVTERRNVRDDYRLAFAKEPPGIVKVIALFTDNDQTGEPAEAYYGVIRAVGE